MRPSIRLHALAAVVWLATAGWLTSATAGAQADGEPDPSFSGDGLLTNGDEPYSAWTARAAAVLPNQDVVVVGDLATSVGMDHLRINVAGTAIATCPAGVPLLAEFEGLAALADRAGRLVVAGRSTFSGAPDQDRGLIGRFTATDSCVFDIGWSDNGWQILDGETFCDTEDCAVIDLAESPTPGARLYALLSSRVNALVARLFVVGFRQNGALDSAFGDGGFAELADADLGALSGTDARLAVDGAGRPVVLATRWDPDNSVDADSILARFTDAGELDTSFSPTGWRVMWGDDALDAFPADLAVANDGAVLFAVNHNDDSADLFLLRPDWSGAGIHLNSQHIRAMVVQGNGRVVLLTDSLISDQVNAYGLYDDGTSFHNDLTFGGPGGWQQLDVDLGGANWQQTVGLVLSGGRPFLVGRAAGDSGAGMFAMRLRNRFVFADGFEIGTTSFWRR